MIVITNKLMVKFIYVYNSCQIIQNTNVATFIRTSTIIKVEFNFLSLVIKGKSSVNFFISSPSLLDNPSALTGYVVDVNR